MFLSFGKKQMQIEKGVGKGPEIQISAQVYAPKPPPPPPSSLKQQITYDLSYIPRFFEQKI